MIRIHVNISLKPHLNLANETHNLQEPTEKVKEIIEEHVDRRNP